MTYIQQWEQMRDKVRNLEQERQTQLILAPHNAYGFKLNINHPLIRPKWDAFKSTKGLGQYGMTDDLRREFEEAVLASKYMQKCMEQEKADLKRQLDSNATKLDAAVRQAKAAGADTDVAACRVYFTELQQTAAKVQELIGKINAKDPATGTKLSAAVIQVLQSTAKNLEVAQ